MNVTALRAIGAATTTFGALGTACPQLLARPSGMADRRGTVAWQTRMAVRPLMWRDLLSGLALLTAPEGAALRCAAWVRMASDIGDAALVAPALPDRRRRLLVLAASAGWGAVTTLALCHDAERKWRPSRRTSQPEQWPTTDEEGADAGH